MVNYLGCFRFYCSCEVIIDTNLHIFVTAWTYKSLEISSQILICDNA